MNIVESWKDAFEFRYKSTYDSIKPLHKQTDTQETYIALYQMIQDAFSELLSKEVNNLYITSSFYKQLQKDMERLDDLILVFIEEHAKIEKE